MSIHSNGDKSKSDYKREQWAKMLKILISIAKLRLHIAHVCISFNSVCLVIQLEFLQVFKVAESRSLNVPYADIQFGYKTFPCLKKIDHCLI